MTLNPPSQTSNTIGLGIIGPGSIADFHHAAIKANIENGAKLIAVSHYDPQKFNEISDRFGVPCVSQEDLLANPDIDAVCICTPSGYHTEQAIAAAQAGKHMLVEKPMALTLEDADRIIEACEANNVKLSVALQRRFEPSFQRVAQAIQAGDLGKLTLASITMPYFRGEEYYAQAEWRGTWAMDGGGVVMCQGIHIVDLLVWYMGDPVEVQALGGTIHRSVEVEDVLAATLRFENGSVATIAATTTAEPGFPHRIELFGTNGSIQIEGESIIHWQLADESKQTVEPYQVESDSQTAGAGGDPKAISASGHIAAVRDLIGAIREDRAPIMDGRESRRAMAAILAMYESAGLLQD